MESAGGVNCPPESGGRTIETAVKIVRGVVPEPHTFRMHSETFRLGNHSPASSPEFTAVPYGRGLNASTTFPAEAPLLMA